MSIWPIPRFLLLAAIVSCALSGQNALCVKFQPAIVELTGVMKRHKFAGPPNYESVKRGDALEIYWLLHLQHPISVELSDPNDRFNEPKSSVTTLQILVKDYKTSKPLLNKRVKITGTLFSAVTGHHHTDVLIDAQKIEAAP